jgi:uncharacterized Zn finger protein (UPF0148 family)
LSTTSISKERNTADDARVFLFYNGGLFCPCCGMQLRRNPTAKRGRDRLRRKKERKKES